MVTKREPGKLYCSFCGKSEDDCEHMLAGVQTWICGECVDLCAEVIKSNRAQKNRRGWCVEEMARAYFEASTHSISIPRMGIKSCTWQELDIDSKARYVDAMHAAVKKAGEMGFELTEKEKKQ
jgi:hypothetical protein